MGKKAGKKCDFTNPSFKTYEERIAYRNGWIEGMKIRVNY